MIPLVIFSSAMGCALPGRNLPDPPAFQKPQSLFAKTFPRPTGNNGYEEYVRAAESMDNPVASRYGSWFPGFRLPEPEPGEPPSDPKIAAEYARWDAMPPLDVYREELSKFGSALALVAAGNGKTVVDPHANEGPEATFGEYAGFKATTKLAIHAALVYSADGRTDLATKMLLDQLRFGDNVGRLLIISNLTSAAIQRIVYRSFGELLPRLSLKDAQAVQREAANLLARPSAARSVLNGEFQMSMAGLGQFLLGKVSASEVTSEEGSKTRSFLETVAARPVTVRAGMMDQVRARLANRMIAMDRILTGPERDWIKRHAEMEESWEQNPKDEIDKLLEVVTPAITQSVVSTVRARTQLRLLGLHARLIEYRWNYGRFPKTLKETDPLTGGAYVYEIKEGGVRLASTGTPETGEIELKYLQPLKSGQEVKP